MIHPLTGRFVDRVTLRQLNHGARRRNAKRAAQEAEYEANWSLAAEDARRKAAADHRAQIEVNNQRIEDGKGKRPGPRHLRRRLLQKAWKERNQK